MEKLLFHTGTNSTQNCCTRKDEKLMDAADVYVAEHLIRDRLAQARARAEFAALLGEPNQGSLPASGPAHRLLEFGRSLVKRHGRRAAGIWQGALGSAPSAVAPPRRDVGDLSSMHEILTSFLKIGLTAYGGPAIIGVMQAEFQERRQWIGKPQFVEGLAFVNMLPGATATQLGIFLGHERAGWLGGLLAGFGFCAPAFAIMLALTVAYAALGVSPWLRGALYGLGPIVLAVFGVAVYRLGGTALRSRTHILIALSAAAAARVVAWTPRFMTPVPGAVPSLTDVVVQFGVIGAVTFGGSLTIIGLLQDQFVHQLGWLTPQEFIDGLALGQLTPGPPVMLATYVAYKALGLTGAVVAAIAIFAPSFVMMFALLPVFERVRALGWAKAALQGMVAGIIGVLAVTLVRLTPYAIVDPFSAVIFICAVTALLLWRMAPLKMVAGGAVLGIVRRRLVTAIGF